MVPTILKRSWILLVVLKSPWIRSTWKERDFFVRSWNALEIHNLAYARQPFFCKIRLFCRGKLNLAHPRCKSLKNSRVTLKHFCGWTIFYFYFSISNAIPVPQMKLQVIPSYCAKSCGGKWYKIMWSTMAEEVKIVNNSITCFSQ